MPRPPGPPGPSACTGSFPPPTGDLSAWQAKARSRDPRVPRTIPPPAGGWRSTPVAPRRRRQPTASEDSCHSRRAWYSPGNERENRDSCKGGVGQPLFFATFRAFSAPETCRIPRCPAPRLQERRFSSTSPALFPVLPLLLPTTPWTTADRGGRPTPASRARPQHDIARAPEPGTRKAPPAAGRRDATGAAGRGGRPTPASGARPGSRGVRSADKEPRSGGGAKRPRRAGRRAPWSRARRAACEPQGAEDPATAAGRARETAGGRTPAAPRAPNPAAGRAGTYPGTAELPPHLTADPKTGGITAVLAGGMSDNRAPGRFPGVFNLETCQNGRYPAPNLPDPELSDTPPAISHVIPHLLPTTRWTAVGLRGKLSARRAAAGGRLRRAVRDPAVAGSGVQGRDTRCVPGERDAAGRGERPTPASGARPGSRGVRSADKEPRSGGGAKRPRRAGRRAPWSRARRAACEPQGAEDPATAAGRARETAGGRTPEARRTAPRHRLRGRRPEATQRPDAPPPRHRLRGRRPEAAPRGPTDSLCRGISRERARPCRGRCRRPT